MKKQFSLLLVLSFLMSCNDQIEKKELQLLPSSSIELTYPSEKGTSGDTINGLLGYGYDVTGFCDTVSVRAKIFDSLPKNDIGFDYPNVTFPTLINGGSFEELLNKINNPNISSESGIALTLHVKSLMKLALKSDSIDPQYAYTYYALNHYVGHCKFYYWSESQKYISDNFKNDVVTLSTKELVSKYGTHVLTEVFSGIKFEVLYRCKFDNPHRGSDCEQLFYTRMKAYIGGTAGIINYNNNNTTQLSQTSEQLIYNSIGSRKKLCGMINASDYNPTNIQLDINPIFSKENVKTQFISIGNDGILPIYELISNETKKQEVKAYIEKYISTKTIN